MKQRRLGGQQRSFAIDRPELDAGLRLQCLQVLRLEQRDHFGVHLPGHPFGLAIAARFQANDVVKPALSPAKEQGIDEQKNQNQPAQQHLKPPCQQPGAG